MYESNNVIVEVVEYKVLLDDYEEGVFVTDSSDIYATLSEATTAASTFITPTPTPSVTAV